MTDDDDIIVLIRAEGNTWLIEGEKHMYAMLSNLEPFPRPVRCISFETRMELMQFIPAGFQLKDFYTINPKIVARLEQDGELVELTPRDDE